jgi:drug/metabolite transporter (DMT)-like permease
MRLSGVTEQEYAMLYGKSRSNQERGQGVVSKRRVGSELLWPMGMVSLGLGAAFLGLLAAGIIICYIDYDDRFVVLVAVCWLVGAVAYFGSLFTTRVERENWLHNMLFILVAILTGLLGLSVTWQWFFDSLLSLSK